MFAPDLFPDPLNPRPDVLCDPRFLNEVEQLDLMTWCTNNVPWADLSIKFGGGVTRAIPRRLAWYGDVGYDYSGLHHPARPMPAPLRELASRIEAWLQLQGHPATFNSVLMNFYRDGRDSIGMHADDETQLEADPTIASVSLGASRTFIVRHMETGLTLKESLKSGSLLVMKGDMQRKWLHGIPKEPDMAPGPRCNLTFRNTLRDADPSHRQGRYAGQID